MALLPGLVASLAAILAVAALRLLWQEQRWRARLAGAPALASAGADRGPGDRSLVEPLRADPPEGASVRILASLLAGQGPPRNLLLGSLRGRRAAALLRRAGLVLVLGAAGLHLLGIDPLEATVLMPALLVLVSRLWWSHRARTLAEAFRRQLADAIALMVRALRAGVPIWEAVADVGRECPAPLGPAFRSASDSVRLGQPLEAALRDVARRVDLPELDFLSVTIAVQRETGGNLAETLLALEAMIRKRGQLVMKVRALSAEARTSALIIGALPLILVAGLLYLAPDYLAPFIATDAGRLLGAAALGLLLLGTVVMTRIVRAALRF